MKDHIRAGWASAILVCGKCSKKLDGGFGEKGKRPLVKALRHEAGFGKGRKAVIGVVETRCLGICPRHAVMVVDTRTPGRWRIVPRGADVTELAESLRGDQAPASEA